MAWAAIAGLWVVLALRLPELRQLRSDRTTAVTAAEQPARDGPPPKPPYPGPPFAQQWSPGAVEGFLQALAGSTDRATVFLVGASQEGQPLYAVSTGAGTAGARSQESGARRTTTETANGKDGKKDAGPWRVAIVAGQHGNEPGAVVGVLQFLWDLCREDQQARSWMQDNLALLVFPLANPDGRARRTRETANHGDMNRDWEKRQLPETAAIGRAIDAFRPDLVIDCHQLIPGDRYQDPLIEVACTDQTELTRMGQHAVSLREHLERRLQAEGLKPRVFFRWTQPGTCLHAYYGVNHTTPAILVESAPNPPGWQVSLHPKVLWIILGYLRREPGERTVNRGP